MNKKVLGVLLLILVSFVSFADRYEINDCLSVSTAIATNVSVARSSMGEAEANASAVAQTENVIVVSNSIASIAGALHGIAVAIANGIAVEINMCPYLERTLRSLGIELQKTIAIANGIAVAGDAKDQKTWNALKGALNVTANKIQESLVLIKPSKKADPVDVAAKPTKKKKAKKSKKKNKKTKKQQLIDKYADIFLD